MIEKTKLTVGGKEIEWDWTKFQREIFVFNQQKSFNARGFLQEYTDLIEDEISKIDRNERWVLDKWELTEGCNCINLYFDIVSEFSRGDS